MKQIEHIARGQYPTHPLRIYSLINRNVQSSVQTHTVWPTDFQARAKLRYPIIEALENYLGGAQ